MILTIDFVSKKATLNADQNELSGPGLTINCRGIFIHPSLQEIKPDEPVEIKIDFNAPNPTGTPFEPRVSINVMP